MVGWLVGWLEVKQRVRERGRRDICRLLGPANCFHWVRSKWLNYEIICRYQTTLTRLISRSLPCTNMGRSREIVFNEWGVSVWIKNWLIDSLGVFLLLTDPLTCWITEHFPGYFERNSSGCTHNPDSIQQLHISHHSSFNICIVSSGYTCRFRDHKQPACVP